MWTARWSTSTRSLVRTRNEHHDHHSREDRSSVGAETSLVAYLPLPVPRRTRAFAWRYCTLRTQEANPGPRGGHTHEQARSDGTLCRMHRSSTFQGMASVISPPPGSPRKRTLAVERKLRESINGRSCAVCGQQPVDPAHVIDRSLANDHGDPRSVVPLCREHHDEYDDHRLDLLPYLEGRFRSQLAFAVERFGLLSTLQRVTGEIWQTRANLAGSRDRHE